MRGAYATSGRDILDGHHRWSGGYLRDGETRAYTNINQIQAPFSQDLLKLLTVVGNAIGRPTKSAAPDEKKMENIRKTIAEAINDGISKVSNILESEDVLNALKVIKKLGINYKKKIETGFYMAKKIG